MFQVPPSKASVKQNRFEFTMPSDPKKSLSLPLLKYLKPTLIAQLDKGEKIDVIKGLLDAYLPGLFDKFDDFDQVTALYEAWAEASGISVGESSASTDS
jgi:hypothetical protein